MTAPAQKGGAIRQALTENLGLKLLALAASIGLFVIVRGTEDVPGVVDVEVVALLPDEDSSRMLISEIPERVRVTLRGSESVLDTVRAQGLEPIQMDLRDTRQHYYTFDPAQIEVRAGVSVTQIAPPSIPLTWVERAERRVRVAPLLEGQLRDGLSVVGQEIEPRTVRVRGAAPEVERLAEVRTTAITVTHLEPGTHTEDVSLGPLPPHVAYADAVSVTVRLIVEEEEGERSLRDLDIAVVGNSSVSTRPGDVNVLLRGPRAQIDAIDPSTLIPFVDVSTMELTHGAMPVAVQMRGLPENMTATIDPPEVLVVPSRPLLRRPRMRERRCCS